MKSTSQGGRGGGEGLGEISRTMRLKGGRLRESPGVTRIVWCCADRQGLERGCLFYQQGRQKPEEEQGKGLETRRCGELLQELWLCGVDSGSTVPGSVWACAGRAFAVVLGEE